MARVSMPLIRMGMTHAAVGVARRCLNAHGFRVDAMDDVFDGEVKLAMEQFQASRGLDDDGIAGPATWPHLGSGPGKPYVDAYLGTGDSLDLEAVAREKRELLDLLAAQQYEHPAIPVVIGYAIDQLGLKEIPEGSNAGPELEHLVGKDNAFRRYWLALTDEGHQRYKSKMPLRDQDFEEPPAWCAIFISSSIAISLDKGFWDPSRPGHRLPGLPYHGRWEGGALDMRDWGEDHGGLLTPAETWPCGVVATMGRGGSGSDKADNPRSGHALFVVADLGGGMVRTIEGNVSNGVDSLTRSKRKLMAHRWWTALE